MRDLYGPAMQGAKKSPSNFCALTRAVPSNFIWHVLCQCGRKPDKWRGEIEVIKPKTQDAMCQPRQKSQSQPGYLSAIEKCDMTDQTKLPISCFIIALNEADRIAGAIESVKEWVDEVIVIDSGSTDGTVEIAENLGAKTFHNDWNGYGLQKRFGETKCKNTWILNIDADERISEELRVEIANLFNPLPTCDIYKIHICDVFAHESKPAPWAFGYWQYRLYNINFGRFSDSTVHDTVRPIPTAKTQKLKAKMHHHSIRSVEWMIAKCNRYSDMQAADIINKKRKISVLRLISEFPISFLKAYFLRRWCLYGVWGVIISYNFAFCRFLRLAKVFEARLGGQ